MIRSQAAGKVIQTLLAVAPLVALSPNARAEEVVEVAPFRSVALHSGGHVILRHAREQKVTLLEGSPDHSRVTVVEGDRLVIDRVAGRRPRDYRLTVEVLTPDVDGIVVLDGGAIEARGAFPLQQTVRAAVEHGGTVSRGKPAEESLPLEEIGPSRPIVPPIPVIPPIPPHPGRRTY